MKNSRDINNVKRVNKELRNAEMEVPDDMAAAFILRGLKHIPKYKVLLKSQFLEAEKLTPARVKSVLLHEERQDEIEARKEDQETTAYRAKYDKRSNYRDRKYSNQEGKISNKN